MQGRRLIVAALQKFKGSPNVLAAAWAKLSDDFKSAPQRAAALLRERRAMRDEDLVFHCKGRTVLHSIEPAPCLACGQPQHTRMRYDKYEHTGIVKQFEAIAAERARALGETRVPIESDLDFMRIACSGIGLGYPYLPSDGKVLWLPMDCRCWISRGDVELRCAICDRRCFFLEDAPCCHASCDGYVTAADLCGGGRYIYAARDRDNHVVPFLTADGESSRMSAYDKVVDMSGPAQSRAIQDQNAMREARQAMLRAESRERSAMLQQDTRALASARMDRCHCVSSDCVHMYYFMMVIGADCDTRCERLQQRL